MRKCAVLKSGEGVSTMGRILDELLLFSCMGSFFIGVAAAAASVVG